MKIAILGTTWPFRGGLAAYNERLAREFIAQGHQVVIHTFSLQYPGFLFPGKTQLASWDKPSDLQIHEDVNSVNPFNWIKTGHRIRKGNPDLIVVKYWLPFMGPCFGTILRIAKRNGAKVVSILDNIIPHESRIGDRPFTNYFVGPVDAFIAQSRSVLADTEEFDKHKPRKLNPHPVFDNFGKGLSKEDACQYLGISSEDNYILFFGFIRDYKGLDLLLEALALRKVGSQDVKVIVAGEFYSNEEKYLNLIERLGIEESVILKTEFIADDEVRYYFSAADVIVQPYKSATQSGVTQIAYHFEKPMIVTNVGGLSEIVPHGVSGLICEPDSNSLATSIEQFFQEDQSRLIEGVKAEKKRFLWSTMVDSIIEMYNRAR